MLYLNRAFNLWYSDLEARRRFQVLTILIAFAYGAFNSLALGRPEKRVTWETLALTFFLTVGFTMFYCFRTEARTARTEFPELRETFQNRRFVEAGLISTIVLAIASLAIYIPNERVQAASLDLRLRQAITPEPFDATSIKSLDKVLQTAAANQIPLNPRLVKLAGMKLLDDSRKNPDAWQGALALLRYESTLNSEKADFPQVTCLGFGNSDGIVASVSDSLLTNCSQELDHAAWKNVVFENVTVVYHGGPTTLENVQFKNCQFKLDNNLPGQQLGKALMAPNGVTISLPGN